MATPSHPPPKRLENTVCVIFLLIFLTAILLFRNLSSPLYTAASELLANGGFETPTGGPPSNWATFGGASLSQTASPVQGGSFAAAVASTSLTTKGIYQTVAVAPNSPYVFSGFALKNNDGIGSLLLRISWYDGTGDEISTADSPSVTTNSGDYQPLTTGSVTAPNLARSAKVRAVLTLNTSDPVTAFFDELSFTGEIPPTPTPTITPSPTATPALTPSPTPTPSPKPAPTATPTPPPSPTATSPVATPTRTPTSTPTPIPTSASLPSPTPTRTVTPGSAPIPTPTITKNPQPTATPLSPGSILINEILINPPQIPQRDYEWVELFNILSSPANLIGWTLADNFSRKALPLITIPPQSYAIIASSATSFAQANPSVSSPVVETPGGIGNGLAKEGDMLLLQDNNGTIIDGVNWGTLDPAWPNYGPSLWNPALPAPSSGQSLYRITDGKDTDSPTDWDSSLTLSPGRKNGGQNPTPIPTLTPASFAYLPIVNKNRGGGW